MGRTLFDVVPAGMSAQFLSELNASIKSPFAPITIAPTYYVHFEAGKRIYQLYAELDVDEGANSNSLCSPMASQFGNTSFAGPWGFAPLWWRWRSNRRRRALHGNAWRGFDRPPIADWSSPCMWSPTAASIIGSRAIGCASPTKAAPRA